MKIKRFITIQKGKIMSNLEILNKYYNGIAPSSLEKEYNLAPSTISYFRKILKLPSYQNPTYSEENLLKASNEYLNGEPLLKTCEKYNIILVFITFYKSIAYFSLLFI